MHQEFLRRLPLFADLSDEDLAQFARRVQDVAIDAGTVLMREGDPGDAVYIVIDGELDVLLHKAGRETPVDLRVSGDVIGEMAPLIGQPRKATIRARTPAHLLKIDTDDFADVFRYSSTAALTILRTVALYLRSMEADLFQQQKMAALGTLAAGLAHELNNPAAALRRAASQLGDAFEHWQSLADEIVRPALASAQRDAIDRLLAVAAARPQAAIESDPLDRARREGDIERWLDDRAVERPWELAPALVEAAIAESDLESATADVLPEHLSALLWWVAIGGVIRGSLAELSASAGTISDIVTAVKSYTHLDRAPVQEIDVHAGIDQTLMLLRHTLRQVRVQRNYAPDLPRITAWVSELNQVWTNLISNAVDAMGGEGELTIQTYRTGDWIVVAIEDDGPGIPPEAKPRLFDPFFTTKEPGQGTGLGLNICYNIVTQKHHGDISVSSRPGRTRFEVTLPIAPAMVAGDDPEA